MTRRFLIPVALAAACLVGCTTYYKVTDPSTGRAYYTTRVEQDRGGAVRLQDARTGNHVTIQNSEVSQVTKEQYDQALKAPATAAPAPVVTPPPPPPPPATRP